MGPGGKGSNQAVATARLGRGVRRWWRSSVTDKLAGIATDLYAAEGVDTRLVTTRAERATGVGFIILNDKGENFIILDMGANELLDAAAVDAADAADRRERRGDDRARGADRSGGAGNGARPPARGPDDPQPRARPRSAGRDLCPCRLPHARTRASCASCSGCRRTTRVPRATSPQSCAAAAFKMSSSRSAVPGR